jgi:hypothetical protein
MRRMMQRHFMISTGDKKLRINMGLDQGCVASPARMQRPKRTLNSLQLDQPRKGQSINIFTSN